MGGIRRKVKKNDDDTKILTSSDAGNYNANESTSLLSSVKPQYYDAGRNDVNKLNFAPSIFDNNLTKPEAGRNDSNKLTLLSSFTQNENNHAKITPSLNDSNQSFGSKYENTVKTVMSQDEKIWLRNFSKYLPSRPQLWTR